MKLALILTYICQALRQIPHPTVPSKNGAFRQCRKCHLTVIQGELTAAAGWNQEAACDSEWRGVWEIWIFNFAIYPVGLPHMRAQTQTQPNLTLALATFQHQGAQWSRTSRVVERCPFTYLVYRAYSAGRYTPAMTEKYAKLITRTGHNRMFFFQSTTQETDKTIPVTYLANPIRENQRNCTCARIQGKE